MKQRDIGLVSRETMLAFGLIVAALIGYMVYVQGPQMMEAFKGKQGKEGKEGKEGKQGKGKWLFNASPHAYPVVCLAGDKHIPCTAFSSA
jgi:hypothetical protein